VSSDERIRVGVIGAGGIANSVHLPSLRDIEAAQIVAVCDIVEARARKAAADFDIPAVYTLYQQMLDAEPLDAVFVLTEPDVLFRLTLNCLRAGKHVLMEKPPGVTTFQARTLLREARKVDRILQVGLNRRYIPVVDHVVKLMREHTPITQVEGRFNKHTSAAFCDGAISALPSDTIHAIDMVRWIAGGEPVAAATVEGGSDDVVPNRWNAIVRFDNGVSGIVRANYMTGGRVHTLEIHGPGASAFVDLGIGSASCGARVLLHGGDQPYSLAAAGPGKGEWITVDGREFAGSDAFHVYYGYLQEDQDFIQCVQQGRRPRTDIAEAVKAMELVDLLLAGRI